MDDLVNRKDYPPELPPQIQAMGALAVEIANRWMTGWPGRVKAMLKRGTYLDLLKEQVELEARTLANPGNNHLARHEILQLYDVNLEAPTA